MELFDTHFHYYQKEGTPEEYFEVIKKNITDCDMALQPKKLYLLAAGASYEESLQANLFANTIENSYYAAGVHPHYASEYAKNPEDFSELLTGDKCVAVGEIGLDYYYDNSIRKDQWKAMEFFLNLALEHKLPAIIHTRDKDDKFDAYHDAYNMLRDFSQAGGHAVVHCFTGSPKWAEKMLELDIYLGVTGIVTFTRALNVRETLRIIPNDKLLIETDSPYLAPVPFRGKTNTPGYLPQVAGCVAKERQLSISEVAKMTTANAFRFFGLKNN